MRLEAGANRVTEDYGTAAAFIVTNRGTNTTPGETPVATINVGPFTPTVNSLVLGFMMAELESGAGLIPVPTGMSFSVVSYGSAGEGDAGSFKRAALWQASAGASPSATTVTFDGTVTAGVNAWYTVGCVDIIGHDAAAPIVQAKTNVASGGSASHSVSLNTAPVAGNLVVACFAMTEWHDTTAMAAPTIGGKSMTVAQDTSPGVSAQHLIAWRIL